jgi:hypothetical protein
MEKEDKVGVLQKEFSGLTEARKDHILETARMLLDVQRGKPAAGLPGTLPRRRARGGR